MWSLEFLRRWFPSSTAITLLYFALRPDKHGRHTTLLAKDHETLDRAGGREVAPPRLVHPCHTDPASALQKIPPFVPLTMMAIVDPCTEVATGLLDVPTVASHLLYQCPVRSS